MKQDYDYIPLSILIFKDKKIIYLNNHMKTTFLTENIPEVIEKFTKVLSLENEEKLFEFFMQHTTFEYKGETVNLKYEKKEYDLFLFTKLNELMEYDTDHPILKQITTTHLQVISYFKGLKLYSNEKISEIKDNKIYLTISKRQKLHLYEDKIFYIIINNSYYSAECTSYNKTTNKMILENIKETPRAPFDRDEVRLKIDSNNVVLPVIDQEVKIYDISEKSISFVTDKDFEKRSLVTIKSIKLPFLQNEITLEFIKKFNIENTKHYVFLVPEKSQELIDFIKNKQREILKSFAAEHKEL